MVFPNETGPAPEIDELRLLKSGRVRVSIARKRRFELRRPLVGEMRELLELFASLRDEHFMPNGDLRDGETIHSALAALGPVWFTHVIAKLGPPEPGSEAGPMFDSDEIPAFAWRGPDLMNQLQRHWMEIPLVSDADEPESMVPTVPMPTVQTIQPAILRQPGVEESGGR